MSTVVGNLRVVLGLDSATFQQGMDRAAQTLSRTGRDIARTGRTFSAAVTGPLAGFALLSLRAAGQFEASMNRVGAVTGAAEADMKRLSDQAKELGATTQFSASQAADAMTYLAMAGFDVQETMAAMPGTLQLAAAAQMDLASAADTVSNVLSGYGLEIAELGRVNDVLAKAFTSANTDLRQLGEAMTYAGPTAAAAGVEFEETAAALGMMGNAGFQASMAGTAMRGALSRALNPTAKMQRTMNDLGLSFKDAEGRLIPFADIIEQLEPHAEDAGLMMELFGQRAGPAMTALVSQGSESLRELTQDLRESGGTAQRIADTQMQGLNGELLKLKSAFEALQIAVAESGLMQFATDMTKRLAALVSSLSKANPEMLRMGVIFGAVAAAIGPLLIGFGLMLQGLGPFIAIIKGVAIAVAGLSLPFTLTAAAIAATVAAIYLNWDEVGPYFIRLANAVGGTFRGLAEIIIGVITGDLQLALDGLKTAWGGLGDFFGTVMDSVAAVFEALPARIRAPFEEVIAMLDAVDRAGRATERFFGRITGAGPGYEGTTAPDGADVIAPPTADMRDGLAGGTAGIRVQGNTDANAYGEGFEEGMGIQSPSRRMIEYGQFMSQGLGMGIADGQGYVDSATGRISDGIIGALENAALRGGSALEGLRDVAISALNDIASSLFRSGLSGLFGAGGLNIPGFANGVRNFAGGLATINERGGELVALPGGSTVIPHDLSKQVMQGQGGGGQVDVRVYMDDGGNWQAQVERISGRVAARTVGASNQRLADTRYLREGR